mmetsp:Transcript_90319/g.170273  ORF Transcript_90319/g.170273 Transcript_90319/m.170273 type:complete len:368 (+) Transcript_90319:12-1115(+)
MKTWRSAARVLFILEGTSRVEAHGIVTLPLTRNAIDRDDPRWADGKFPLNNGHPGCTEKVEWNRFCGCWGSNGTDTFAPGQACLWFSQGCTIGCPECDPSASFPWDKDICGNGMEPTICDPMHRTLNTAAKCGSEDDWTKHNPWRAPGSAPVYDACGKAGGQNHCTPYQGAAYYISTKHAKVGDLGSKVLPYMPSGTVWMAGEMVKTAWTINANHGGGYQYRLCPRWEELTEECFQRLPVPFAGLQQLQFKHRSALHTINGTYVSEGTSPAGSTWVKNPIPISPVEFPPPCQEEDPYYPYPVPQDKIWPTRCWGDFPSHTMIIDWLRLPSDIVPGEYVLGWRWDGEQSAQIWSACADVTIVSNPLYV